MVKWFSLRLLHALLMKKEIMKNTMRVIWRLIAVVKPKSLWAEVHTKILMVYQRLSLGATRRNYWIILLEASKIRRNKNAPLKRKHWNLTWAGWYQRLVSTIRLYTLPHLRKESQQFTGFHSKGHHAMVRKSSSIVSFPKVLHSIVFRGGLCTIVL